MWSSDEVRWEVSMGVCNFFGLEIISGNDLDSQTVVSSKPVVRDPGDCEWDWTEVFPDCPGTWAQICKTKVVEEATVDPGRLNCVHQVDSNWFVSSSDLLQGYWHAPLTPYAQTSVLLDLLLHTHGVWLEKCSYCLLALLEPSCSWVGRVCCEFGWCSGVYWYLARASEPDPGLVWLSGLGKPHHELREMWDVSWGCTGSESSGKSQHGGKWWVPATTTKDSLSCFLERFVWCSFHWLAAPKRSSFSDQITVQKLLTMSKRDIRNHSNWKCRQKYRSSCYLATSTLLWRKSHFHWFGQCGILNYILAQLVFL